MKVRILAFLLIAFALSASAQRRIGHDPLNADEADKLRDTAQLPNKRLKLYMDFAKARLGAAARVAVGVGLVEERDAEVERLVDDPARRLKIDAAAKIVEQFQLDLRKLSQAADDLKNAAEAEKYKFALTDALESLKNNADDARHTVQEQNALAKGQKLHKEEDIAAPAKK